ncbi:MAG: hypothetical protein HN846_01600 [Candidatus Pacebacteria bacterium]|nr:hypothetical protein [Candidatus Paceibacterota bacterium]MBT3511568.1 hypothetical protein [Candidatus Paceibacterota bacterium]MBT4004962.1 hypothetical protein [Candidatus Paceibacterota bacterium]MBT4358738.1 hypothetical protein [Candidatus Paceibacterota bacterium]MBT4680705.1 hypothetical protein [Candidatus Paceibacterota bacterium]
MADNQVSPSLVKDTKISSSGVLLPVMSGLVAVIVVFLVYAFFKGWTFNFYANILFGFYALTKQIWVSVVLLGVTQTLLMVPFRAIRVMQSHNTQKFQDKIDELKLEDQQIARVKKNFRQGNMTFLFYVVDFMIQITLFISIGRLFLTDFYANKIDPSILLKFIPYPVYPLQGLWFKIPYPIVTRSKDFGLWIVFWAWILILLSHVFIYLAKRMKHRFMLNTKKTSSAEDSEGEEPEQKVVAETKPQLESQQKAKQTMGFLGSSTIILFVVAYIVVRNFPLAWEFRIFSGDVSIPNRTLNTVTAIATFIMVIWFGLQDILRQGKLAQEKGISEEVIEMTQAEMFKSNLFNATLIGLGAFFITNLIPSAFELSIFTFELIAISSPFTLDKFILKLRGMGQA